MKSMSWGEFKQLARRKRRNRRKHKKRCSINKQIIGGSKDRPCMDCEIQFSSDKMTYDHVHGIKIFDIADGVRRTTGSLKREIAKCEVVCRDCHDVRERVRGR
jgi:hypothetical protein